MRIFHIALESDWQAAQEDGRYAVSTLGRTLAEEGFIHASRADQWQTVRKNFYADVEEPLVLLVIDTERLDAPVVEEPAVPGGEETFPHIYGVIEVDAVVNALPIDNQQPPQPAVPAPGATPSLSRLFLEEMMFRLALGTAVVVLAGAAGMVTQQAGSDGLAAVVTVTVLIAGGAVAFVLTRRRDQRYKDARSDS
ncbi:DUF952 domain-containing protein [Nocardioides speluncae]|uniref:DUF952 domain-containing protein n=1 Tax=Nocardioides speluncae TaxID=2670337 RepID=UPI000D69E7E6|nr:DUF952 domain-containing protein [Nocardioides speluncae]